MRYKGYEAVVRYSDEDRTFVGEIINTRDILVFDGSSVAEIETSFHSVIDEYLEDCEREKREPNKPFSGRFVLRVEPGLHRDLYIRARSAGKSLNAWVNEQLGKAVKA